MDFSLEGLQSQCRALWGGLSTAKKAALLGVAGMVLGGLFLLVLWGGRPTYRVLFSNLSQEDAAAIVERLRERKVAYRLAGGGGTIEVPDDKLYDLRLAMATDGLPQGGGIGFELFDRNSFGATEFVQRVNLQRALQGELARTIRQFPQIAQARVHLSLPERSLFVREERRPRATVVVQLKTGAMLQPAQLQGIVHLVASSVQGMLPQDVHVVDTMGRILYSPRDGQSMEVVTGTILELQQEMESRLEGKIRGLLEPIVGSQKVVARVHVDLDARRVEETQEQFDPDKTAVRSEQRTKEKSTGTGLVASGVPGVLSNLPNQQESASRNYSEPKFQRENETVNYEVNRVTRRTFAPMGNIRRLTVAVLVDGVRKKVAGADGNESWEVVPRTDKEIRQYQEIVKQAVGFNPQRGDQVQVASAPFEGIQESIETRPASWPERLLFWISSPLAKYGVILFVSLLFLLLIVRPLVKGVLSALQAPSYHMELPKTLGELEGETGAASATPTEAPLLTSEVTKLAETDPRRFAEALRVWMRQEE